MHRLFLTSPDMIRFSILKISAVKKLKAQGNGKLSPSSTKPWQWPLMVSNFRKKVKNLGWSRRASAPRCMVHVRRYLGIFARDEDCVHLLGKPLLRRSIMTGHWQPRPLPAILTRILPSTPTSQFNQPAIDTPWI